MAIGFDAATESAADNTDVTTNTFSHTVAAGTHRILMVHITWAQETAITVSGVTYNGVALTASVAVAAAGDSANCRTQFWHLVDPAVGAANVVVTMSGECENLQPMAVSFNSSVGAISIGDSESVVGASVTTAPSVTLSPVTANDFCIDGGVGYSNLNPVVGADQTQRSNGTTGISAGLSYQTDFFCSTQPGSAGGAMSWTRGGVAGALAYWALVLIEAPASDAVIARRRMDY